jgi:2-iminoacetate synthase
MMFSEKLQEIVAFLRGLDAIPIAEPEEVRRLLEKRAGGADLTLEEIARLVVSASAPGNRELILDFSRAYRRPLDDKVLLLPPLYIDSRCENHCRYCNFGRHDGERLSVEEFREEFDRLLEIGYRSIEIVSSHDPELFVRKPDFDPADQSFEIDGLLEYFDAARAAFGRAGVGMLTTNIPPLDTASLKRLKAAGLDCFLVWAETFDPEQYRKLHVGHTPKARQSYRLDSFERAIAAGIEHVAGAFLKGLFDWRREEVVLYALDRHLARQNGRGFSIIGTPRIKGPFRNSGLIRSYDVSDETYELNIALDRVLFDGVLWLQTRESFAFNRRLIETYGGGIILTIDSSTAPGGYKRKPKGGEQFPVHKSDRGKAVGELEAAGFEVVFDWTAETLARALGRS